MSLYSSTIGKNVENFHALSSNLLFPFASMFVEEQVKLASAYNGSYAKTERLNSIIAMYWTELVDVTKKYELLIDEASE